jgi:glycosyltransferase involved in cell wall biosynthesis
LKTVRILILSFYYPPDLSACSFRSAALVRALLERLPSHVNIELITTLPNRYDSFTDEAPAQEELPRLTIHRVHLRAHGSGMFGQARAFVTYARDVMARVRRERYDLVYGTSSRLMTAALSSRVARKKRLPLYLDIRDIFADTIKDVLPGWAGRLLRPLFSWVERWTIGRADAVNLVSRGFESYFSRRYPAHSFSFFTNGIDEEFMPMAVRFTPGNSGHSGPVRVVYAGNIGEGQGLHAVLPELALRLEGRAVFRVIGDGGRKQRLVDALARAGCTNVELLPPMKRTRLMEAYRRADVLFLHLNDYPAFRKVLPSKLFEYAATGKPVWAGVAGYAATFVESEIENAQVFPPCDVDHAVQALDTLTLENVVRTRFLAKYDRTAIMREMASDIVRLLPTAGEQEGASA